MKYVRYACRRLLKDTPRAEVHENITTQDYHDVGTPLWDLEYWRLGDSSSHKLKHLVAV